MTILYIKIDTTHALRHKLNENAFLAKIFRKQILPTLDVKFELILLFSIIYTCIIIYSQGILLSVNTDIPKVGNRKPGSKLCSVFIAIRSCKM